MAWFIGHRRGRVEAVTDAPIKADGLEFIPAPKGLVPLGAEAIISGYVVRRGQVEAKVRPAAEMRIALVTVWEVPCGIATYAKALYDEMRPLVADLHVFAEHENDAPSTGNVTRCWQRGESLAGLSAAILDYAPDAVIVQHEYGNFPRADHWLALMSALMDYRVVVTLHSVYGHQDKAIVEASCGEIVVHTPGAKDVLRGKGVSSRITVIPHGCRHAATRSKLWNLYATPHTILQFGFGFPYKGWENAIRTVAALRERYPDVFYTGLMSERWPGTHAVYQRNLYALATELGVADRIGLIRGYQADTVLDAFLRTNQVGLFPYIDNGEHTVYGCSGAARSAMTAGIPVVTSNVPLFEDLADILPQPSDVAGWADAVADIFEHGRDVAAQDAFLAEHSWADSARRYLELIGDAR